MFVFFDNKDAKDIVIIEIVKMIKEIIMIDRIIYIKLNLILMIGSHIYLYTI